MENWVKIYSTTSEIDADLVISLLKSNDIESQVISKKDSWNKFDVFLNSSIDIYVEESKVIDAKDIMGK